MEKIQSTRELFLNTLTKMGIKYEIDKYDGQAIWFDYQDMEFNAEEDKDSRYITLEYIDLKSFGNIGEVIRMRRIINKVNKKSNVVISTTIKSTHYCRSILFIKEIPDIEDYLRSELQALIRTYEKVNEELQKEIEKDKKNTDQRNIKDDDFTQIKDLFIKTITEMDCEYEPWENNDSSFDSIVFEYQSEQYRAIFFEMTKKVLIENHYSLYGVELSDLKKVNQLREAVNKVNMEHEVNTVYTIDNESEKMYAEASCIIPFMAEMPHLIYFLHDVLDDLYNVRIDIECEMEEAEEIEKMGDLHQEPN